MKALQKIIRLRMVQIELCNISNCLILEGLPQAAKLLEPCGDALQTELNKLVLKRLKRSKRK